MYHLIYIKLYRHIHTHTHVSGHMIHIYLQSILKSFNNPHVFYFILLTILCSTRGNSNYAHFKGKKTPWTWGILFVKASWMVNNKCKIQIPAAWPQSYVCSFHSLAPYCVLMFAEWCWDREKREWKLTFVLSLLRTRLISAFFSPHHTVLTPPWRSMLEFWF